MPVSSEPLYLKPPSGGSSDLVTSDWAGWTSLRLRLAESVANGDEYETAPKNDLTIRIVMERVVHSEVRLSGRWKPIEGHRGLVAVTPPAHTWQLRYNNGQDHNVARYLHLYIPSTTLNLAAEQLLPRTPSGVHLNAAIFEDKATTDFALVLLQSLKDGVSDFYAETGAQWLSAHLLSKRQRLDGWLERISRACVTDLRILRVLEYIEEHIGTKLSLTVLAHEAGISPLQFAMSFQKQMGVSPNKHVHTLRMQNASRMLSETNSSSAEIALLCGFKTASHFSVAFCKHFGQSPLAFRAAKKWNRLSVENRMLTGRTLCSQSSKEIDRMLVS